MGVFEVFPSNFFSVLTSKNRELYADALILLHQMFQFELNVKVDDYLADLIALQEDREFLLEDDDEVTENTLNPTAKSRLILNRFIRTGWVEKEFLDGSFVELVTPKPCALPVLRLLNDAGSGTMQEYNSLVFSTYSGLKQGQQEGGSQMYEAVLSAKANTEQLTYHLRSLYHSIRGFLKDIEDQASVNQLLAHHFEDYKALSDRIYHPIKTMDSVHRYMTPIQQILQATLQDEAILATMCGRAMTIHQYETAHEAEDAIISHIDFVQQTYRSLDGIINQIDQKHGRYTKQSIDKMRYLMTTDLSVQGKLTQLLQTYGRGDEDVRGLLGESMERHIQVNRQEFLDGNSLYHKNMRQRRVDTPSLLLVDHENDFSSGLDGLLTELSGQYSLAKIGQFVESFFLHGIEEISSQDITLENHHDLVLLILAVIREKETDLGYSVTLAEGQCQRGVYRIPNMIFRKTGGLTHVD